MRVTSLMFDAWLLSERFVAEVHWDPDFGAKTRCFRSFVAIRPRYGIGVRRVFAVRPEKAEEVAGRELARAERRVRRWAPAEPTLHESRVVTGITVGKDQMMARIYDKTIELQKKPREEDRTEEYRRWAAGGWDGAERVARVEFQIRGEALRTFGARDPAAPIDPETGRVVEGGLCGYVDRLWQACLNWIRLVVPEMASSGKPKPVSRLSDDPRWALLRGVTFTVDRPPAPARRRRVRGGCSPMQELGAVLSTLAARGLLESMSEQESDYAGDAEGTLRGALEGMHHAAAGVLVDELVDRWASPAKACVHLAVRVNAAIERVRQRRAWDGVVAAAVTQRLAVAVISFDGGPH